MKQFIIKLSLTIALVLAAVWLFEPDSLSFQKTTGRQTKAAVIKKEPETGLPVRLIIPKINLDAAVEQVGLDSQGRMDVPKDPWNVAWYDKGFRPGENGSAVIAGHLDTATSAAVFYQLDGLVPGDDIYVNDDRGKQYHFVVSNKESYPFDRFPLEAVFASEGRAQLNLVTCQGVFDLSAQNYSNRLVIYSEMEE